MRDYFCTDICSILISWELFVPVCGNHSWIRGNCVLFASQYETLALFLCWIYFHTCKKMYFKRGFSRKHLNMTGKKTVLQTFLCVCVFFWQSTNCFTRNFQKRKKETKVGGNAGAKAAAATKCWDKSERLDGARTDAQSSITEVCLALQQLSSWAVNTSFSSQSTFSIQT